MLCTNQQAGGLWPWDRTVEIYQRSLNSIRAAALQSSWRPQPTHAITDTQSATCNQCQWVYWLSPCKRHFVTIPSPSTCQLTCLKHA